MAPGGGAHLALLLLAGAAAAADGTVAWPNTTVRCVASGAWSDACAYTDLCFVGSHNQLGFITADAATAKAYRRRRPRAAIHASTKLLKMIAGPPNPSRDSPLHFKRGDAVVLHPSEVAEGTVVGNLSVRWHDRTVWVASYSERLGNIWFYSTRILPLFTAHFYRELWGLPSVDDVVIPGPEDRIRYEWHTRVLEMAVPEHAHVSFASEAPYYGFRNGVHCFKRAVLLGANMFGFPDMITAFEFRQRAYAHLGLVQPNTTATTSNRRVVLLDRHRGAARRFHNARDMLALIRGLGVHVEHVVVTVNTTFEEQVRLMASTGVLVSMHGAGLMNQIFLPPGAAVIEVFPVNFKHVLYERIAHYMGVYHFKVYSTELPPNFGALGESYRRHNCSSHSSVGMADNFHCWRAIKNADVVTPLAEFRSAILNALDHIDYWKTSHR